MTIQQLCPRGNHTMKPICHGSFIGIDVSKGWIDIAIGNKYFQILQQQDIIENFITEHISRIKPSLCVIESTGGYERLIVKCLQEAKLKVHIAHPNRVRAFAQAKGLLAKTDKLDAFVLSAYGNFIGEPAAAPALTETELKLQDLQARYKQIKEMLHGESCRLGNCIHPDVKRNIERVHAFLKSELAMLEAELQKMIDQDESMLERQKIMCTMKGVGLKTSQTILINLPEIGKISRKQVAALVGVAPMTQQSGKKVGVARTQKGRGHVRQVLYMAALVASQHNPVYKEFYNRLTNKGKPPKVALVAIMRKMLVTLNAMVRSNKAWVM
jgi:transposase